jgi:hypothetical protein
MLCLCAWRGDAPFAVFFMSLLCVCVCVCRFVEMREQAALEETVSPRLLCFAGLLVYRRVAGGRFSCVFIKILHFLQIMRFCMILKSNSELLCATINKCTMILQFITLLRVSTLSCHPQGACNQYLAKLHKYFKCSCW